MHHTINDVTLTYHNTNDATQMYYTLPLVNTIKPENLKKWMKRFK